VITDLEEHEDIWKAWYDEPFPENVKEFPMGMILTPFQLLLFLRIFRPDRVYNGMKNFIIDYFQGVKHYV